MKGAALRKFDTTRRQSKTTTTSSQASDSGPKKSIPGPASPTDFVGILFYHLLKKPLGIDPQLKVGIYLCFVSVGSVFFDLIRAPPSYFSNKYNFPNQMFVKWGWGWTSSLLAFFICSSSFVYTGGDKSWIRKHLMRLLVGSVWWFVWTNCFNVVENMSGYCFPSAMVNYTDRRSCHRSGGTWMGFDISGHTFLLILSNMWILEETRAMRHWSRLRALIEDEESPQVRQIAPNSMHVMKSGYRRLTGSIKAITVALSFLSLLWDAMLFMTVVYFHNMPSKFIAVLVACGCWFVSYKCWFPSNFCSPGMPGDGLIKYTT